MSAACKIRDIPKRRLDPILLKDISFRMLKRVWAQAANALAPTPLLLMRDGNAPYSEP